MADRCAREPIHTPGAIQPHGALLAVSIKSSAVTHASANLEAVIGVRLADVFGRDLHEAIGVAASNELLKSELVGAKPSDRIYLVDGPRCPLYLHAHRSGSFVTIDIEPMPVDTRQGMPMILAQSVVETFRQAANTSALCDLAVIGLKKIAGYDRVMAYRFGKDGHGEVIAEAIEPDLSPYLGLHYPSGDIPPQARRQYLLQRVGAVVNSSYVPVPLVADPLFLDASPLDLTHSVLRSVSPVHCEYMRNMQTAASLTIGLAHAGELWGMLVCHHRSPRVPSPELRAVAGMIGEVVSLLIAGLLDAETQFERAGRVQIFSRLVHCLKTPMPLRDALLESADDVLGLVGASGALIRIDGEFITLGRTPAQSRAELMLAALEPLTHDKPLAVDDFVLANPSLEGCREEASGALLLTLGSVDDDAFLWFRPERSRTVAWGGNPASRVSENPVNGQLTPRTSFAAWKEIVEGHSVPWSIADQALAVEFGDLMRVEIAHRTQAALRESEERFQLLAEHSGVVVTLNDMDSIRRYVSPAAENVLGWRPEQMVGHSVMDLVHPDDRQALRDSQVDVLEGKSGYSACYRFRQPDGSWLWVEGHTRLRESADCSGPTDYVVVLRDATARKAAELELTDVLERMKRMASIDGLTGIANRRHFDDVAELEWRRCERERLPLSVLLLDADHFKLFNDHYGHQAGDDCLRAIAGQIASMAKRPGDLAARYGGEEFLLLLPNTELSGATKVAETVRTLIEQLAIPHASSGAESVVTVSIGVAAMQVADYSVSTSIHALLALADAALYLAKDSGRNCVAVASPPAPAQANASQAFSLHAKPVPVAPLISADHRIRSFATFAHNELASVENLADTGVVSAHEALVQFLYSAPIGLVQTKRDGTVEMINPMSASLLMPVAKNGDLDNLFEALSSVAPDLRLQVEAFPFPSGVVCESLRVTLPLRNARGVTAQVLSISLSKLDDTRLIAMVSDVTLELEREQSGLAFHLDAASRIDSLTQLPNRFVARDQIDHAIARRGLEPGYSFAVLFINCDRFKQINDSFGHLVGDTVLKLMAGRLASTMTQRRWGSELSDGATVARLGGDEFVVLLDNIRAPEEAALVAQRLLDVLTEPYDLFPRPLHISVSIGVVIDSQVAADADAVLQDASIAMVEAKRAGGGRYLFFEASMHERALELGSVESDLRRALGSGELFVVYQPVVALQTKSMTISHACSAGVEALVRWNHPTRGLVSPIEFIGVAERCGLIGALGEFVLATACRQFVVWKKLLGDRAPRLLAVNLSRGQLLEPGFAAFVAGVLADCAMDPAQLQLEVTESLAAQDASIQARLHELKALGLTLALDDFGTGYSSLASLHELPVDTVKIDRSFVSEAVVSTYHRVLIEATILVAKTLNMSTVAEGIETEAQAVLLRDLGCEKGQGYLFCKPLSAVELAHWLTCNVEPSPD